MIEEPTPTQEIWKDVSSLQKHHTDALMELYFAVLNDDKPAALIAHERIKEIENLQKIVHGRAREHARKKALARTAQVVRH